MKKFKNTSSSLALLLIGSLSMMNVGLAQDINRKSLPKEIADNPRFQKQFYGSYGFDSDIEPSISDDELETLQKVFEIMREDLRQAQVEMEALVSSESSAVFDFTLANIYYQRGKKKSAVKSYRKAIDKFPNFRRAHKNLAFTFSESGLFQKAIPHLTKTIELGGGDGKTFGLLAACLYARGDFIAAESAFRSALVFEEKSEDYREGLMNCLFQQEKFDEVISLTKTILEKSPDRVDLWELQARSYEGLRENRKAAENYEFIIRMGKATPKMLNHLGNIYLQEDLVSLAISAYEKALMNHKGKRMGPEMLSSPLKAAEILVIRGDLEEAKAFMAKLKKIVGSKMGSEEKKRFREINARIALAEGGSGTNGGKKEAEILKEVVAKNPLDGDALVRLGNYYGRLEQNEKAAFYYERAASIEKFEASAKIRHAQLLVKQSKYREALPLLRQAQSIDPKDTVAQYLAKLERSAKGK